MAKFETTSARQELGFSPATAVRANIDVSGQQGTGAAIGQALVAGAGTLQEGAEKKAREAEKRVRIEEKRRQMMDANSAVVANKLRQTADAEFETFKLTNPQETWEPFRIRQTQKVANDVAELDFSPNVLATQQLKSESYSDIQSAKALTAATRQLRTDTIEAQQESLVAAFRSKDPNDVVEATSRYIENGANMGKDKAEVLADIKAAKEAGEKLKKRDTLDGWRDRIAEEPTAIRGLLEDELEARKTDDGVIPELESSDIQSLLNTATNREAQLLADTQAAENKRQSELETQLHDDIVDGNGSITIISNSNLKASAKRRLIRDLTDKNERDVARTWAIQDSDVARVDINALLTDQEAGFIDINQARNVLAEIAREETADGRSIMTSETFDKASSQITKGGRDAIDEFVETETVQVSNFLLTRLTDQDARLKVRADAGTLTPTERRQVSSVGFLLQVAKHQRNLYEAALDARVRELGIEDTSGNEVKIEAAKIWESFKRKDLTRQINDFTSASGQKLVKPTGFPETTWEGSDARNRAAIVHGVSKGFTNSQILEASIK